VDIGEAQPVRCLTRGLWLAERDDARFALLLEVREAYRGVRVRLEVAVAPGDTMARVAARIMGELRTQAEDGASWRGKVLVLEPAHDDYEISPAGLRVEKAAPVRRDDIVLPEKTLALIERNTVGFVRDASRLAQLGLSAKKGVLLFGPPGTGKTLVVRWLAGSLEGYTKIIVTAGHYGLLEETLAIARALQPALVVLEDIDLVGGHRDGPYAARGGMLNLLLNEMDGVAPEARLLFVLTTNRPEVLEPALAARPGRVDQAIEVCLPGESERRLLVRRYAGALWVPEELAVETARRIGRVSPAFIKELMRRAAQSMLERDGGQALESRDIERALEDMLRAGGRLGARMLGAENAIGFATTA
jgi:ATP-dependent 26S proteasome regulatory subunit